MPLQPLHQAQRSPGPSWEELHSRASVGDLASAAQGRTSWSWVGGVGCARGGAGVSGQAGAEQVLSGCMWFSHIL